MPKYLSPNMIKNTLYVNGLLGINVVCELIAVEN